MSVLDKYRQHITEDAEKQSGGDYAVEKKLKKDHPNIMRIVDQEHAIEYFEIWVADDDGNKKRFIVENDPQGKGILAEMLGDRNEFYHGGILDSRLDEYKNKYFYYEQQDPELILQVAYNNDKSGNQGNWRPRRAIAFSIIDREPEFEGDLVGKNWCIENKHLKMFTMGSQGFEGLMDVRDNSGNIENYDINYKKTGKGKNNTKHSVMKAGDDLPYVIIGEISPEEKAYEAYDLKIECALSSAKYILKYLSKTIARIDGVMGTTYLSQLQAQANMEVDTNEEGSPAVQQAPVVQDSGRVPQETVQAQEAAPVAPVQQTVAPVVQAAPVAPVTPVEQAAAPVVQEQQAPVVAQAQQVPVQQEAAPAVRGAAVVEEKKVAVVVAMTQCPFCKKEVPGASVTCPECNKKLLEPCDECKVPFSVVASTCPNCGKNYNLTT